MPSCTIPDKILLLFFCALISLSFPDCREKNKRGFSPPRVKIAADTASYYLDSAAIAGVFEKIEVSERDSEYVWSFYAGRDFSSAWINRSGPNDYAGVFINLLHNEDISPGEDSTPHRRRLLELFRSFAVPGPHRPERARAPELELLLTLNFFHYADRNWGGVNDTVLNRVSWFIERKQLNYSQVLAEFLSGSRPVVADVPVYGQYALLRESLRKLTQHEDRGTWPAIGEITPGLKKGDSAEVLRPVRQLLYATEDLAEDNGSDHFDEALEAGVRQFQLRHGFSGDGVLDEPTIRLMRVPLRERIRQVLINMERCRWVPLELKGDFLFVNIPEFRLYVYREGRLAWTCKTIVGISDPVFKTVIFNDSLEFIVFNPYWNIQKNILHKEVLPAILKDPNYLTRNNLEVVDRNGNPVPDEDIKWKKYTENFPYIIRERPGERNSLGRVKFLFPNPYEIYFHDTPAKALFEKTNRAFSHGCIRLEQPFRLASFLLRHDSSWTSERVEDILGRRKETFVKLRRKVPVFIAYFTAWVDRSGRINLREDLYGHDEEMKRLLFVN